VVIELTAGGVHDDRQGDRRGARSPVTTHGGAPSAPAARLGSGRSPPAGPRRQTRLEAQAQAKVAIQPSWLGPESTSPLGCGNCGKESVVEPQTLRALDASDLSGDVRATLRRPARCGITRNGRHAENPRKERELLQRTRPRQRASTTSPVASAGRRRRTERRDAPFAANTSRSGPFLTQPLVRPHPSARSARTGRPPSGPGR
jgi:hypothetical protein